MKINQLEKKLKNLNLSTKKAFLKTSKVLSSNKNKLKNFGIRFFCGSIAVLTAATSVQTLKNYIQNKNNVESKNISASLSNKPIDIILKDDYGIEFKTTNNHTKNTNGDIVIESTNLSKEIETNPTKEENQNTINSLKLMSFNLEMEHYPTLPDYKQSSWDNRKQHIVEQIKELKPSVICFQEITTNMNSYLSKELENYESCFYYRVNSNPSSHSLAIYYDKDRFEEIDFGKIWLSETPEKESLSFDGDYRICCWEKLKDIKTGKSFVVMNTHYTLKDKEAQSKSSSLINEFSNNFDVPVFLMGDFNSHQFYPCYSITTEQFDDSSVIAKNIVDFGATYNGYDKKYRKNNPIDRIFCKRDSGISVVEYELCDDYTEEYIKEFGDDRNSPNADRPYATSDHFPIIAEIVLEDTVSNLQDTLEQ